MAPGPVGLPAADWKQAPEIGGAILQKLSSFASRGFPLPLAFIFSLGACVQKKKASPADSLEVVREASEMRTLNLKKMMQKA